MYYYVRNLQGDVVQIRSIYGTAVVEYTYDAWGNVLSISGDYAGSLGKTNPIRYRGYFYDFETGFYYLQSRYYDPQVRRFISADDPEMLGANGTFIGYNLYAYCDNNPVMYVDSNGNVSYSGIVGFGVQIMISANVLAFQGFIGVEALWFSFTGNNNFGNGLVPWCYWFFGGSMGVTLDFNKILSPNFFNNPKNVLNAMGLGFCCSISISFFLITAKNMEDPADYTREFSFNTATVWGITVSKAFGGRISTYGVGFAWEVGFSLKKGISIGKKLFGTSKGISYYWVLPIGKNASSLYNIVKGRV